MQNFKVLLSYTTKKNLVSDGEIFFTVHKTSQLQYKKQIPGVHVYKRMYILI